MTTSQSSLFDGPGRVHRDAHDSVTGVPAYPSVTNGTQGMQTTVCSPDVLFPSGGKPTYECVCRFCEEMFLAGRPHAKVCKRVECRRAMWRESTARDYSKNAAVRIAQMTKWRMEHPERFKATQARYRFHVAVPCGVCGRRRYNSRGVNPLCVTCAATQRHAERAQPCKFCGRPQYRKHKRGFTWCDECLGQQSHAADLLGLTRERIRQLVNAKVAKVGGTKADALRLVLADRGVPS